MRVCFWENETAEQFSPLTLARPVFELICGRFSLRERLLRAWDVDQWGVWIRSYLTAVYREEHPEAYLNHSTWLQDGNVLLINGRWLPADLSELPCVPSEVACCEGEVVALWLAAEEWDQFADLNITETIHRLADSRRKVHVDGELLERPWDLVEHNSRQLIADFPLGTIHAPRFGRKNIEILGPETNLSISPLATIEPFVVIDARSGPVTIDERARINAFTRLEGPCHIGRETQVFRGQISSGSSIGPVCRIGGEVENAIVHGYSNKYHDGFLGHSYVCPWVNIGAQSGTSDLKFDYSNVRVPLAGDLIETGRKKVGSFIGDHTKTAVNSLFDTGSSIGVMAIVLPDGDLIPRHVPSFSRYWRGGVVEGWPVDKLFDIARTAMSRREMEFTSAQEMLFRMLHDKTEAERRKAFDRYAPPSLKSFGTDDLSEAA